MFKNLGTFDSGYKVAALIITILFHIISAITLFLLLKRVKKLEALNTSTAIDVGGPRYVDRVIEIPRFQTTVKPIEFIVPQIVEKSYDLAVPKIREKEIEVTVPAVREKRMTFDVPIINEITRNIDVTVPTITENVRDISIDVPRLMETKRDISIDVPQITETKRDIDIVVPSISTSERHQEIIVTVPKITKAEEVIEFNVPIVKKNERELELSVPTVKTTMREIPFVVPKFVESEQRVELKVPKLAISEQSIDVKVPKVNEREYEILVPKIKKEELEVLVPRVVERRIDINIPRIETTETEIELKTPKLIETPLTVSVPNVQYKPYELTVPQLKTIEQTINVPRVTTVQYDVKVPNIKTNVVDLNVDTTKISMHERPISVDLPKYVYKEKAINVAIPELRQTKQSIDITVPTYERKEVRFDIEQPSYETVEKKYEIVQPTYTTRKQQFDVTIPEWQTKPVTYNIDVPRLSKTPIDSNIDGVPRFDKKQSDASTPPQNVDRGKKRLLSDSSDDLNDRTAAKSPYWNAQTYILEDRYFETIARNLASTVISKKDLAGWAKIYYVRCVLQSTYPETYSYDNTTILQRILDNYNNPDVSVNWWIREIGIPKNFMLGLWYEQPEPLTKVHRSIVDMLFKHNKTPFTRAAYTGVAESYANLFDKIIYHLIHYKLADRYKWTKNEKIHVEILKTLNSVPAVKTDTCNVSGDGLYADASFIFHDNVSASMSYLPVYLDDLYILIAVLNERSMFHPNYKAYAKTFLMKFAGTNGWFNCKGAGRGISRYRFNSIALRCAMAMSELYPELSIGKRTLVDLYKHVDRQYYAQDVEELFLSPLKPAKKRGIELPYTRVEMLKLEGSVTVFWDEKSVLQVSGYYKYIVPETDFTEIANSLLSTTTTTTTAVPLIERSQQTQSTKKNEDLRKITSEDCHFYVDVGDPNAPALYRHFNGQRVWRTSQLYESESRAFFNGHTIGHQFDAQTVVVCRTLSRDVVPRDAKNTEPLHVDAYSATWLLRNEKTNGNGALTINVVPYDSKKNLKKKTYLTVVCVVTSYNTIEYMNDEKIQNVVIISTTQGMFRLWCDQTVTFLQYNAGNLHLLVGMATLAKATKCQHLTFFLEKLGIGDTACPSYITDTTIVNEFKRYFDPLKPLTTGTEKKQFHATLIRAAYESEDRGVTYKLPKENVDAYDQSWNTDGEAYLWETRAPRKQGYYHKVYLIDNKCSVLTVNNEPVVTDPYYDYCAFVKN